MSEAITIVPEPCGCAIGSVTCGDAYGAHVARCRDCVGLGARLADAALDAVTDDRDAGGPWSPWCAMVAWNLAIAALLAEVHHMGYMAAVRESRR